MSILLYRHRVKARAAETNVGDKHQHVHSKTENKLSFGKDNSQDIDPVYGQCIRSQFVAKYTQACISLDTDRIEKDAGHNCEA